MIINWAKMADFLKVRIKCKNYSVKAQNENKYSTSKSFGQRWVGRIKSK